MPAKKAKKAVGSVAGGALRPLTIDDLKDILGRTLIESQFRDRLRKDPAGVLASMGIGANPKALKFFAKLNTGAFAQACDMVQPDTVPRPPNIVFFD